MPSVLLRPDPWLGGQLGCAAYHMTFAEGSYATDKVAGALAPLRGGEGAFADASVPTQRYDLVTACVGAGMQLLETNLRLERLLRQPLSSPRPGKTRDATATDKDEVVSLAASCLRCSRFHRDPFIKQETADALKAAWAGNYFAGNRGDGMVVAESDEGVAGFLLYIVRDADMIIDLVAVAQGHRGTGLGASLVEAAARRTGAERLITGTQLTNVAAVGFYETMGFRITGANHTFHYHGKHHENWAP